MCVTVGLWMCDCEPMDVALRVLSWPVGLRAFHYVCD